MDPLERRHPMLERLRRRKERHAERGRLYRWATVIVGSLFVLVGVVIIPVPGPWSLPLVLIGLAMLALEFEWAERFLEQTVDRAEAAKQAATHATPLQKALTSVVFVAAAAAAIAAVFVWDVPLLPV